MNHLLFLLVLLLICAPALSQDKTAVVKAKTIIYEIPALPYPSDSRKAFDTSVLKTRTIKKETELPIITLANCHRSLCYDAYIFSLKKKYYLARSVDVKDTSFIASANSILIGQHQALLNERDSSIKTHERSFDSILAATSEKIHSYEQLISTNSQHRDSLLRKKIDDYISDDIKKHSYKNRYKEWVSTLPIGIQKDAEALAITYSSIGCGYFGVCDYEMWFINMSPNKTIKYLYWTGKVKNGVGDYISCDVKRTSTFSGHFTGPVKPYDYDTVSWDGVLINYDADSMILQSIRILYTDGTSRTIGKKSLEYMCNIPSELSYYATFDSRPSRFDSMSEKEVKDDPEINKIITEFEKDFNETQVIYQNRCRVLKDLYSEVLENGVEGTRMMEIARKDKYRQFTRYESFMDLFKHFNSSQNDTDIAATRLLKFENKNFIKTSTK